MTGIDKNGRIDDGRECVNLLKTIRLLMNLVSRSKWTEDPPLYLRLLPSDNSSKFIIGIYLIT